MIKTYKAEAGLNLEDNSITIASAIKLATDMVLSEKKLKASLESIDVDNKLKAKNPSLFATLEKLLSAAKASEDKQFDLLYGESVLVSTGMNLNDDFFLPEEVWAARKTPVNKPINSNHESKYIIGHITDSKVIDKSDGSVVADNTADKDIPTDLDVETSFVVYKMIYPTEAAEIEEKGPKGEKFVSMEVYFFDFGYAIFEDEKTIAIIDRNEQTAFLTKYLRSYGGSGSYQEKKIGRVLRNLVFCGEGVVDRPANPDSIIKSAASFEYKTDIQVKGENEMTIEELQAKVAELEKEKSALVEGSKQLEAKVADLTKQAEDKDKLIAEKDTTITATKTELETAQKSLIEIGKDKTAQDRLAKLIEAGLTVEKPEEEIAKLREMTDKEFDKALEYASIAIKQKQTVVADTEVDETVLAAEKEAAEAAKAALASAENTDIAPASTTTNTNERAVVSILADALSGK